MASTEKNKLVVFWILTVLIALSQTASGVMDLTKAAPIMDALMALGYPSYIVYILGPAKLIGVAVLLAPKLPRLKEWAYAGFAIDFIGAALSHILNGDTFLEALPAIVWLVILMVSYKLRPSSRRLEGPCL
jgi:hypothetical protein